MYKQVIPLLGCDGRRKPKDGGRKNSLRVRPNSGGGNTIHADTPPSRTRLSRLERVGEMDRKGIQSSPLGGGFYPPAFKVISMKLSFEKETLQTLYDGWQLSMNQAAKRTESDDIELVLRASKQLSYYKGRRDSIADLLGIGEPKPKKTPIRMLSGEHYSRFDCPHSKELMYLDCQIHFKTKDDLIYHLTSYHPEEKLLV